MALSRQSAKGTAQLFGRYTTYLSHILSLLVTFPAFRQVPNYTTWWLRHECEQLAQSCYLTVEWVGIEPATFKSLVRCLTITPPSHLSDSDSDNGGLLMQVMYTGVSFIAMQSSMSVSLTALVYVSAIFACQEQCPGLSVLYPCVILIFCFFFASCVDCVVSKWTVS